MSGLPSSSPPTLGTSPSVPSWNKSSTVPDNLLPSSVGSSHQPSLVTPPSTGSCSPSVLLSDTSPISSKGRPSPSRRTTCRSSMHLPRNLTPAPLASNVIWATISEFNCTLQHFPGKKNPVADILSRNSISSICLCLDYELLARLQQQDPEMPSSRTSLTALQWQDVPFTDSGATLLCDISNSCPRPWVPLQLRRRVSTLSMTSLIFLSNLLRPS